MSGARFRSRPVECEAIRWTGDNEAEVEAFCPPRPANPGDAIGPRTFGTNPVMGGHWASLWVAKSKSWCHPMTGDWIIREADGSGVYPCAAAVFEQRWEPIDE